MGLPLETIARLYNLELSVIEKISGGYLSENFVLTDGLKKYFLKKHRHTNRPQVEGVCLAEQFFAEGGVPVILPIRTLQGNNFFEIDGRFYSLYPFIKGRHFVRGTLTRTAAVSMGATLAKLHKHSKNSTLQISEYFNAWDTTKFLSKVAVIEVKIQQEKPLTEFGTLALEAIRLKKEQIEKNTKSFEHFELTNDHLTHGDYFCDNVFFDEQDRVSYIFDFEKVQHAPPLYELYRSLFISFFANPTQENISFAKACVDAYLGEYPFPYEVRRKSLTVAFLKQIHSLWVEEEHYIKGSTRPDKLILTQLACNRYYFANRDSIEAYLLN
jgi:Ser/Thr protein kinase RdoA (MazF antagonist)